MSYGTAGFGGDTPYGFVAEYTSDLPETVLLLDSVTLSGGESTNPIPPPFVPRLEIPQEPEGPPAEPVFRITPKKPT